MELLGKLKQDFNNGQCTYIVLASICKWFRDDYGINVYARKVYDNNEDEYKYVHIIEYVELPNDRIATLKSTELYNTYEEAVTEAIKKVLEDYE